MSTPETPAACKKSNSIAEFYHENGYYIAPDALSRAEVEALRADTVSICDGEYGDLHIYTPEVAKGREQLAGRRPGESDDDLLRRFLCIHFPHKTSPIMLEALSHPRVVEVLTAVIGPNVKCMQSMLFVKSAGKPGQAWHQDEDYIPTRDRSLCGAWIALDDATTENGCLWIIPGSHKPGILWPQEWHSDRRFDCSWESRNFPYTDEDAIPVEVKAGTVVFFNGYTLHRSLPNRASGGYRRALVNHYMSAESFLPWFGAGNAPTHVAMADHRDIVMVAGTDPHAYKGITNTHRPGLRPGGDGGCFAGDQELAYTD